MNKYLRSFLLFSISSAIFFSCKDKKKDDGLPKLANTVATTVTHTKSTITYDLTADAGSPVTETGIVYSTNASPTLSDTKLAATGTAIGSFTVNLSGLNTNTKYYVRPYATNTNGTGYGPEINFTTQQIKLGDKYAGGIVVYLDNTGLHGIVSAEQGLGLSGKWGCKGTAVTGTSTDLGKGQANTNAILAVCTESGIAAKIADDLVTAGYNDWYLPSKDEMAEMYKFRVQIGFNSNARWSSSESDADKAIAQSFDPAAPSADPLPKDENHGVRPVRSF